jgi:hypothetical protein
VLRSDRSDVEVSSLNGDRRGYLVPVNHNGQVQEVTVSSTLQIRVYFWITPDGAKVLALQEGTVDLPLGGQEGAILEWQQ